MRGLTRKRSGFMERGVFLQGVLFPAGIQMGGGEFSKTLVYFGGIWKKGGTALAKCLLGGRCADVSYPSRGKRSRGRGLGLEKEQHWGGLWLGRQRCLFPRGQIDNMEDCCHFAETQQERCSPGEVHTKGKRLWARCWWQELCGWSRWGHVEGLLVLRRIHGNLTKKPHLGAGSTQRTPKAKLLQAVVRDCTMAWWVGNACLFAAPFSPPQMTEDARK